MRERSSKKSPGTRLLVEEGFNPIEAGVFWQNICALSYVSPLFVVQLSPNLAGWYSGIKSPKGMKHFDDVITITCMFLLLFEIFYLLSNLVEILHKGQFRALISNLNQKNPMLT